jgi:hypothetical protein
MTLARVAFAQGSKSVNSSSSVTITGVTAGNALLILIRWDTGAAVTVSSVTCPGETVVAIGTPFSASLFGTTVRSAWYAINNVQSSGDKTISTTLSAAPAFGNCTTAWEVGGQEAAGIFDSDGSASGASSAPSVNVTTTVGPTAIFAWAAGNSSKPTAGSGYTAEGASNIHYYDDVEYDSDMNSGSAGSKTVAFTGSQTQWGIHAIAIKESGAGGGGGGAELMGQACL